MFAQSNYPQAFGDGSTIAENGSLLTAFSNLLERFGEPVDPPTLLHYFQQQSVAVPYAWDAITTYDGNISISGMGTGGLPLSNDSIVSFSESQYHLVDHIDGETIYIVDSLDSLVKPTNVIPLSWASYAIVTPPKPEKPQQLIYMDKTVDGINYKNYGDPKRMYIAKQHVSKIDFGNNATNLRDFYGVPNTAKKYGEMVRIMGIASYPVFPAIPEGQKFYMDMDDWGEFTRTGKVKNLYGYFESDLSSVEPPMLRKAVVTDVIVPKVTLESLNFKWLRDDHTTIKFRVMQRVVIKDYLGTGANQELLVGTPLNVYGTFWINGNPRWLIKLQGVPLFQQMYGVPESTPDGRLILEELEQPDLDAVDTTTTIPERKVLKTATFSDHVVDFLSRYEAKVYTTIKNRRK